MTGTSNGSSPNDAATEAGDRPAARRLLIRAEANASIEPSASASGRTWQASQTLSAASMILTARDHSASLVVIAGELVIVDLVVCGGRSPVRVGVTSGYRVGARRGDRRIRSPGPGDQILDSARRIRHRVLAEADRRSVLEPGLLAHL